LASTALLSSLASFEAAFAQEVTQLPTLQVHDELATSVQRANQLRHNSPNAKIVIEAEQLNQFNDQSIGDAIRRLPGVTFSSPNRSRSIKLRGLGKEYTTVLLDGRPIIDGDSSRAMEVDRIPTIFVERLEITRSPLASDENPGAGGTINIITKRNFGPTGGAISVGGGHVEISAPQAMCRAGPEDRPGQCATSSEPAISAACLKKATTRSTMRASTARRTVRPTRTRSARSTNIPRSDASSSRRAKPTPSRCLRPICAPTNCARRPKSRTNAAMTYIDRRTIEERPDS
jgi:hypothetical protein